jgi:hypothetical protein
VTSQQAQIQLLIDQIDRVLNKTSPRLPWVMSGEMSQQRQVLERTRDYLLTLQQRQSAGEDYAQQGAFTYDPQYSSYPQSYPQGQSAFPGESPQQVLQAVLQEMNYLRRNMMQPLRSEVEMLQQQKAALSQEIRQLEAQRQQYALPPQPQSDRQFIAESIQTAMARLQENLSRQMAQMQGSPDQGRSLMGAGDPNSLPNPTAISPVSQFDRLQMSQSETDQMLLKLDSTLRVVFESLLRDVRSYQDSLGQELQKMHSLGQQGEALFAALLNRLAQQLGREASSYVRAMEERGLTGTAPSPETEPRSTPSPLPGDISEAEINQLLDELTSGEPASTSNRPTAQPNIGSSNLNQLGIDLDNLELETPGVATGAGGTVDEDITIFQTDEPLPPFQLDDDDDLTLFQVDDDDDDDLTQLQMDEEPFANPPDADLDDLDSALDMLNQLGMGAEPNPATLDSSPLSDLGITPTPPDDDLAADSSPDNDEIDELYESLFGSDEISAPEVDEPVTPDLTASPFPQPLAEAEAADFTESTYESQPVADPVTPLGEALFGEPNNAETADDTSFEELLFSDRQPLDDSRPFADPLAESELPGFGQPDTPPVIEEMVLGDDLFTGIDDPDGIAISEPSPEATSAASQSPQTLEDFLFTEDQLIPPNAAADLAELPPEGSVEGSVEVESIASLSDLTTAPESATTPDAPSDLPDSLDAMTEEDNYVPAAPDENLLVNEEPETESRLDLRLAADTLQQLTADLSSLEGLEVDDVDLSTLNDESDWMSERWAGEELPEPPPAAEPEQMFEQASTFPPEDLESDDLTPIALPEPPPATDPQQIFEQAIIFPSFDSMEPVAEPTATEAAIAPSPSLEPEDTSLADLFDFSDESAEPQVTTEGMMNDSPDLMADDATIESLFTDDVESEPPTTADNMAIESLFADEVESEPPTTTDDVAIESLFADDVESEPPTTTDDVAIESLFADEVESEPPTTTDDVAIESLFADDVESEPPTTTDDVAIESLLNEDPAESAPVNNDDRLDALFSDDFSTAAPPPASEPLPWSAEDLFGAETPSQPDPATSEFDQSLTISGFGRNIDEATPNLPEEDLFAELETESLPPEPDFPEAEPADSERLLTLEDFADVIPADPPTEPPETIASSAQTELTLDDFATDIPSTQTAQTPSETPNTFTLEGLDILFEDLPDVDNPQQSGFTTPIDPNAPDSGSLEEKKNN